MDAILSPKPQSIFATLYQSLLLYGRAFFETLMLGLAISVTAFFPRLLAIIFGHDIFQNLPPFSPLKLLLFLLDLIALFFFTAMLWRVRCVIYNQHETIKEDMKVAIAKIPLIIVAAAIQLVIFLLVGVITYLFVHYFFANTLVSNKVYLYTMALLILFEISILVFLSVSFYFYQPLILTENQGMANSLVQSLKLVWNNWWRTFWVQITPWAYYLAILLLVRFGANLNIHIYYFPHQEETLGIVMFHILMFALFIPWIAATLLVQLHDLEVRKGYNRA